MTEKAIESASSGRGRVLIVDDEIFFLEAIDEILTEGGFETVRADCGETALELARDPDVGVVVLDVRLPDLDGVEVLARIRAMRPEVVVLMLSASTDQELILEALRQGAADYLAKPLHDEELVLAVGRAVRGFDADAERQRSRKRIERLVEGMQTLSERVRLASQEERAGVLRQSLVEISGSVLEAKRVSLMLMDAAGEALSVVAETGAGVDWTTMSTRKVGEGPAGLCFYEGVVINVPDAEADPRFSGHAIGRYESRAFACVPLVCLGTPVGVLCLTDGDEGRFFEDPHVLRLLGMQASELLAADPSVDGLLAAVEGVGGEGREPFAVSAALDGDAEIARAVCEAIAAEVEPERVLRSALAAVAGRLRAAPVSLHLADAGATRLELEAGLDGGLSADRDRLDPDRGLTGGVLRTGQLVAVDRPEDEARFDPVVDTAEDGRPRPLLCVPIRLRDKTVGVLRVFLAEGASASPRTAEVLGATFSAAVRNVLLYRSLLQSIEEVAAARKSAGA